MHALAASVAGEVARNRTSNCSRCDTTPLAHLRHLSGTAWLASRPAGVHTQASDSAAAVRLLFSWRAHRHPIVHVEYLPGIEGVMGSG